MPEVFEAYEEGGTSIGRAILHDRSREEYFWRILGGLKLWPRWYLMAFMTLYKEQNPKEAKAVKMRDYRRRKRKRMEADG